MNRIGGLFGRDKLGRHRLVAPSHQVRQPQLSLPHGACLFFTPEATTPDPPRLLTRADSWPQRASRAFAAELLAPAAELRGRVGGQVTYEGVGELAREFGVSEMVVAHQLENHGIARVVDL